MNHLMTAISWPLLIALLAGAISLTVLIMQVQQSRRSAYHLDTVRLETDHQRLEALVVQMEMFCTLVEKGLSGRLHAPTHEELDGLLQKLQEGTIAVNECVRLHGLILERADELIVEGVHAPDLEFPRLMTLWAIKIRLGLSGYLIPEPLGMSPLPPHDTPPRVVPRGSQRPHDV
jgi:hypothetical protein